jgi:hypothetical protein
MPTAARLVAAIAFLAVAFLGAEVFKPGLTPDTQWGLFPMIAAGVGAVCGWMIAGARAGRGWLSAGATGMRTSVTIVFWLLLLFSGREMVLRSMKRLYDGPFEGIVAVFALMLQYGQAIWTTHGTGAFRPDTLIVLLGGGFLAGLLTEWAGRQWK